MASLLIVAMKNLYVISISMDYMVSAICIVLMYSWNAKIIECVCFCCTHHSSASLEDQKNLELSVTENKDNSVLELPSRTSIQTNPSAQSVESTADETQFEIV